MLTRATSSVISQVAPRTTANITSTGNILIDRLRTLIPEQREKQKYYKSKKDVVIDNVTVEQVLNGMKSLKVLFCETSKLDSQKGIKFRGKSIDELQELLPSATRPGLEKGQPLPEATLWQLLTGEIPNKEQVEFIREELMKRSKLPKHIVDSLSSLPKDTHPMVQYTQGILFCQPYSEFAKRYSTTSRKQLWEPALEDCLNIVAKVPTIAANIYNNTFRNVKTPDIDTNLDISAAFNRAIGFEPSGKPIKSMSSDPKESIDSFDEFIRLYFTIHSDHEGGNVSSHVSKVIGSALSDPYLAFSGGMNGLAGPLHGRANQEVLTWTLEVYNEIKRRGCDINEDIVKELAIKTLESGHVIPGFGHAVLRTTDPRYTAQHNFALKHLPHDELFHLVCKVYDTIPKILMNIGKVKNPWPNVDAHSGSILYYYGLRETNFYTVLFGVSRSIGITSQYVWDRAMDLSIERPDSINFQTLDELIKKAESKKNLN